MCDPLVIMPAQGLNLGPVTFGAPAMLYGALALAAPVAIHLMLRTRARRVPLPTVRFVIKTQRQTRSAQRLKHLLLLLLRMLAIALLVAALAQPKLTTAAFTSTDRGPVEAVFCFDDSASMTYRSQDQTTFERARQMGTDLLRDRRWLAVGSRVAVLTGSLPSAAARTTLDLDYTRQQVERLGVAEHGRGLAGMTRRAYELLDGAVLDSREVYLFTDLTRQAWQALPPGAFAQRDDVTVYVVDVGVDEPRNTALTEPTLPKRPISLGEPASVRLGIEATHRMARLTLELLIDGKVRWRSGTIATSAGQRIEQVIPVEGLRPGLHQGRVRLLPTDALAVDNERYLSIHVGRGPAVALVAPPASPVADVLEAMIAPRDLADDQRPYELVRLDPAKLPAGLSWSAFASVVLADVPGMSVTLADSLGRFVGQGGHVLFVPGPNLKPDEVAPGRELLPALPVRIVDCPEPMHILPEDARHPMLAPFEAETGLSLSEPALRRVVRFGDPIEGARVLARLDDGSPAIITHSLNQGSTTVLAFAPLREWSDLVVDAGPMLVLLHAFIEQGATRFGRAHHLTSGATEPLPLPARALVVEGSEARTAEVAQAGTDDLVVRSSTSRTSRKANLSPDAAAVLVPTSRNGNYLVTSSEHDEAVYLAYSVNTPSAESDLRPIDGAAVAMRFAQGRCEVLRDLDEITNRDRAGSAERSLAGWFAVFVLAALLAEGLLSNRFYRMPADKETASAPTGLP